MKTYYKFDSEAPKNQNAFVDYIKKQGTDKYPKLLLFINNPDGYYKSLGTLSKALFREKRLLVFDSPNRAKITHEYDYEGYEHNPQKSCQFLFSPASKLSWLKIFLNSKRLVIASQNKIKKLIYDDLQNELEQLVEDGRFRANPFDVLQDLWSATKANPCFVYLPDETPENFLLEFTYYSSVVRNERKKDKGCWLNYVDERVIDFPYQVNSPNNPWLYVQAPNKYEVEISDSSLQNFDCKKVDADDPGIVSRYIIRRNPEASLCNLAITIKVPKSLKSWYNGLMVIGSLLILALIFQLILAISGNQSIIVPVPLAMAVVAAFIATRGWMIQDETILSRYSHLTIWIIGWLISLLVIHPVINMLNIATNNTEETITSKEPPQSIDSLNQSSNIKTIDTNVNDTHNINTTSFTNIDTPITDSCQQAK